MLDRDVDPARFGHCWSLDPSPEGLQAQRGAEPRELRLVCGVCDQTGEAESPRRARVSAISASSRSISASGEPVRLRHEDRSSPGSTASQSSATYTASAPSSARVDRDSPVRIPLASMNSTSGGSRLRAPTSATCSRQDRAASRSPSAAAFPTRCRTATSPACSGRRARRSRRRRGSPRRPRAPRSRRRASSSTRPARPGGRAARRRAAASAPRACRPRSPRSRDTGARVQAASAIASPPVPHARGTRTSPAPNSRPHEWHWYSGPSATAVSVRQSGQRARSRLTTLLGSSRSAARRSSPPARRARRRR